MASLISATENDDVHLYEFFAMGGACSLQLFASSAAEADLGAGIALGEVERIQAKYSRYDTESLLSVMNRRAGAGETVTVDEETAGLLDFAFACHQKSGGLFDITAGVLRRAWNFAGGALPDGDAVKDLLPLIGMDKLVWRRPFLTFTVAGMEIDLGGIGKEYAVDRVATLLKDSGIGHGLVDLGGDLFALGPRPDGAPWQIGLRHPRALETAMAQVALAGGGLTTSGDYERYIERDGRYYSHILSPKTGWPVEGLSSVTVKAPQCMVAGSITTIAMLKGFDGISWLESLNVAHHWVGIDGRHGGNLAALPVS